jgi:excisionase family DNA binding protein
VQLVLTVPSAASKLGRNPETIRRWIRSGRLRARKVGTQHVIEETDLAAAAEPPRSLPLPREWRRFDSGRPVPDWVAAIQRSRREH